MWLAKRDISGAFRLLWADPADVELLAAELPWDPAACAEAAGEAQKDEEADGPAGPAAGKALLPGPHLWVVR